MIHNPSYRYFSASSDLSIASWTTKESGAMDKCGHCDNCTRPEGMFHKDVTLEAWQTLKIVQAICNEGGRQTISGLSDLARGAARGVFEAGGKRKTKEKVQLDYDAVAGGKVVLSKDVRYHSSPDHLSFTFFYSAATLFTFAVNPLTTRFWGDGDCTFFVSRISKPSSSICSYLGTWKSPLRTRRTA